MVGMNAVIMDEVELGDGCIVGALTFIRAAEKIPPRSLVVGNPFKISGTVSDEMLEWKTMGTKIYQNLPEQCFQTLRACDPLQEEINQPHLFEIQYETFRKKRKDSA
ncbi:MAG: hypothetical protein ACJ75F_08730, partial [Flavisolibacter sp.]